MNDELNKSILNILADPDIGEQFKKLVLERINVMPDTIQIAIGSDQLTKESVMEHVREEDEIGRQVMEIELGFLRDLASGAVYANQ